MKRREVMHSTTIPILRYQDAERAIDWLCRAFGFDVFLKVHGDRRIDHARLILDENMVMVASLGREGAFEDLFRSPARIGGITQAVSMVVADPKKIYDSARSADAKMIDDLADSRFGGQLFSCADLESHIWVFGSHDPWKKFW